MNRQERLRFCKACKHQKFDTHKGIICSLTNAPAEFQVACTTYSEDPELKHKVEMEAIRNQLYTQEADKGKRFINHLLDGIFAYIFMFFLAIIVGVIVAIVNPEAVNSFENNIGFSYFMIFFSFFIYYLVMEATTGRTLGKMITRTKVIDENGNKPDFSTILIRSFCRLVPFNALSFLFAERGWHDAWSKTRVVESK
ncbi:RDD family protein [Carboxylicivirga sediminis]|uniref:RDD family protein n=1 Tax=Carboxylicivirga sediminis TaxID=2006564 RepID=A0A941F4I6_9BACT|nr:RDD family protein [Carboxylicivirga sediminis]MBR8535555.1 RDD family protein [Carboxylicivirga sediminis]